MEDNKTVLAIVAHPDDAEFLCAGTLALLKNKGWEIEMATMTAGNGGSKVHTREEISVVRKKEAATAASMLDAKYHCLEMDDVFILYDQPSILKTIKLIREVRPKIVFTMSPSCYMVDHEMTSKLVRTACFAAGVVNIETKGTPSFDSIPYLYYMDAMEGKDKFGNKIKASIIVDISTKIELKEKMLGCHKSQKNWLFQHHGMDEYTRSMKDFSKKIGIEISSDFGEGFRQHLGHAYPQNNILKQELGDLVFLK